MQSSRSTCLLYLLLGLVTAHVASAETDTTVERIIWDKQPIRVQLNVGDERRVQFRAPVSVGIPASLQGFLRVQTVNGTVYFLSRQPFMKTRVLVRELGNSQTYLMDVTAIDSEGPMPPMSIHVPTNAQPSQVSVKPTSPPGYVSLTRFAAQQLYAPERLLQALPGIQRVPLQDDAVEIVPGGAVVARPLISWRAGSLYVTAVKLVNQSKRAQTLDPRTLRGQWLSATFQHARLLPSGSDADSTAAYLVSAQSFRASL